MYSPEDHQQHVGRARTTLYQRQIRLLCITWLPIEGARWAVAGKAPALRFICARSERWEHACSSPSTLATGSDYVIFALKLWRTTFYFQSFRGCFIRYTALSAEFVFNLSKLRPNI